MKLCLSVLTNVRSIFGSLKSTMAGLRWRLFVCYVIWRHLQCYGRQIIIFARAMTESSKIYYHSFKVLTDSYRESQKKTGVSRANYRALENHYNKVFIELACSVRIRVYCSRSILVCEPWGMGDLIPPPNVFFSEFWKITYSMTLKLSVSVHFSLVQVFMCQLLNKEADNSFQHFSNSYTLKDEYCHCLTSDATKIEWL